MSESEQGYAPAVVALAPAFTLKALAQLPASSAEYVVERRVGGDHAPISRLLAESLKGRATGKFIGGSLGVLTAPLYMRGIKQLASKDTSEHTKGYANLALAGASYAGMKGLIEESLENRQYGARKALADGSRLGISKALLALPAALIMGRSVAVARRKSQKEGLSHDKLLTPLVTGAVLGAAMNSGERGLKDILAGNTADALKHLKARAYSGAVGGALGGLISAGITELALKSPKEKTAGVVDAVLHEAGLLGLDYGGLVAAHQLAKPFFGVRGYTRAGQKAPEFVSSVPGLRRLQKFTAEQQAKELGVGLREGLAGRVDMGLRAKTVHNLAIAENRIPRELGIQLGSLLRGVPENRREKVLERVRQFVLGNPELTETTSGHRSVLKNLPPAIDIALGRKPIIMRSKFGPLNWLRKQEEKIYYGGRGILGEGLPTSGKQDAAKSKMRLFLEETPVINTGLILRTLGNGLIPGSGMLSAHMLMNSLKSVGATTPPMAALGKKMAKEGFKAGLFKMRPSDNARFTRTIIEGASSPQAYAIADLAEGAGALLRNKVVTGQNSLLRSGIAKGRSELAALKRKKLIESYKIPTMAALGAAGVGTLANGN